jgi:hypothetical protein
MLFATNPRGASRHLFRWKTQWQQTELVAQMRTGKETASLRGHWQQSQSQLTVRRRNTCTSVAVDTVPSVKSAVYLKKLSVNLHHVNKNLPRLLE